MTAIDAAVADKLADGQRCYGLAHGRDNERRLWCHRAPGRICHAKGLQMDDPVFMDDAVRKTRIGCLG